MGDSLERIRRASPEVRSDAGYQLELVRDGEMPTDFRPMPDVGSGAVEIRLLGIFAEAVYVLHCFDKKTQATRPGDLELGRRRFRALLEQRTNI